MRVLVVHGSKRGGTAGLAEMVADALREHGFEVHVRAAAHKRRDLATYDAVVVGGGLYAGRWHRDARRFVRRYAGELSGMPVWMFSSGPLDSSAAEHDIPPVKQVQAAMDRIGGRQHVTFGGYLAPDAKGFPASAMARRNAGDWRDADHVRKWVEEIAGALSGGMSD
jgi:menaquinone-dependent protoporphyrinogen oxidase